MNRLKNNTKFTDKIELRLIAIIVFAVIGAAILILTRAATGSASFSFVTASPNVNINQNISIEIYENSLTEQVAAVDVKLSFDPAKFTFVSIDGNGVFTNCFENIGNATTGTASLVCSKLGASFTGNQKIGTLVLTAKVGSGSSTVSIASGSHIYKNDGIPTDLWNGVLTSTTINFLTPDTTPPLTSISLPANGATVKDTQLVNATASDNSGVVTKVEFYINGVLRSTDTDSPYSFPWDTTVSYPDGSYTLLTKAYDGATPSNVGQSAAVTVTVQNSKPDLSISSVSFAVAGVTTSPLVLVAGDQVTVSAVISNNGLLSTTAGLANTINFSVNSVSLIDMVDNQVLNAGSSRTITATVKWPATAGSHSAVVQVDKNNLIAEANESNNSRSQSFNVLKQGDISVNNAVDSADLAIFTINYGKSGMTYAQGDLSRNGTIGSEDVALLATYWGR